MSLSYLNCSRHEYNDATDSGHRVLNSDVQLSARMSEAFLGYPSPLTTLIRENLLQSGFVEGST